jgi:putative ABC transport system permease protein
MTSPVPVARRNALADRRRLLISVAGTGAAIALVFLLQGLWTGFLTQISAYEDHAGADLFVGQPGARNFFGVPSVLPPDARRAVEAAPGVRRADAIAVRYAVLDLHGRKQFVFLVGSDPGALGGPWDVSAGRIPTADDEIVVDATLARQHGVAIGDAIAVMGARFDVVGLSEGTRSWMASFVFVTRSAIANLLGVDDASSFLLVRSADPAGTARVLRERTDLAVLTPTELGDSDRALLGRVVRGPIVLMIAIAVAAGTLTIALTVYSAIVERIREYGIAKAIGASGGRLFRIVLGQTCIVAGLGTLAGYVLFLGGARLLAAARPQMWVRLPGSGLAIGLALAAAMAALAAIVPTRRIARLEPASVYGGAS